MSVITQEIYDQLRSLMDEGLSQRAACSMVGVAESTYRYYRGSGKLEEFSKPMLAGTSIKPHKRREKLSGKRYIFTAAQNNTYVHKEFLSNLEAYAGSIGADIIVGTFHYNKNGFQNGESEDTWFDPAVTPYVKDNSCELRKDLLWCGELNILPTAVNPLSGLDTYCKSASGIIPHTKVMLTSVPTSKGKNCRMLYTTGAVTKSNYIQQKAGQKAEFHHVYGALLVEIDKDGDWFCRQLSGDSSDGSFQDLDIFVENGEISGGNRVEAINYGDIHSEKPDMEVYDATFGEGGLLDYLMPRYQFANDTLDFYTRNHHNIKDPYHRYKLQIEADGMDTVEDDLIDAGNVLITMEREWCQTIVVESNHDLALMRWLKESEPKHDNIWNAIFYHKCQGLVLRHIAAGTLESFSIFEYVIKEMFPSLKAKFLKEDESFTICNYDNTDSIECGAHGHLGANGSRGSVQSYRRLGEKHNIGHGHSATILDSVYMAGIKGSLEQGYNKGASSWSHSDIVTYPNGKRAMVTFKNGNWRA